jgi:hypothetical protein
MTAPHPVPPLVALAALAALFFALLAMSLPAAVSDIDLGSGGQSSAAPAQSAGDRTAAVARADNVFRQPVSAPLQLFAGR